MIYLDTSVVLAEFFAEDMRPNPSLWNLVLFSSRLLELELWNRIHARGAQKTHGPRAEQLLRRINFVEFSKPAMERALHPFPIAVRTLDAIHLAAMALLIEKRVPIALATLDKKMQQAAKALSFPLAEV